MNALGRYALLLACAIWAADVAAVEIDARYSGGNIAVDRIDGDVVYLRPDLRDTGTWWFYWNFRVRGAEGRALQFVFAGPNPIGVRGPAVSIDGGSAWSWLGKEAVEDRAEGASFRYSFPKDAHDMRFAFAIPYQQSDLREFVADHADGELTVERLCRTSDGRNVELLRIAAKPTPGRACVLLTARHHACETMASYVLEGLLDAVLEDDELGRWLRAEVDFVAVPLVDVDGVEAGDQGKNRQPHDHWLDYQGVSRYPAVAAVREFVPQWSAGRPLVAIDLHCSYLREAADVPGSSEQVFFMNSMVETVAEETLQFQTALARVQRGPLRYERRHDLPFGQRWNQAEIARPSFLGWASSLPGVRVATVLEVPYANAGGVAVTSDSSRQLGRDLAVAMKAYFFETLTE